MKVVVVFFILLITALSFAQTGASEYKGILKITTEDKVWTEGEIRQVLLQIYPLEDANIEDVKKKLEAQEFCDFFYFGKVESISFSKNNPLVLEVIANATLKKAFNRQNPLIWSYMALNIPITLENIELKADPDRIGDYVTLNVARSFSDFYKYKNYMLAIGLLGVIISIYFYRKFRVARMNRPKLKVSYKKMLLNAKSRFEIEEIYRLRKEIEEEIGLNNPVLTNLFTVINKHQFRPKWDEDIEYEINFILDEIKESLK